MENKRKRGIINRVKWSPVSAETDFKRLIFGSRLNYLRYIKEHEKTTQVEMVRLTPVVDPEGNLFNPFTQVVFNLN